VVTSGRSCCNRVQNGIYAKIPGNQPIGTLWNESGGPRCLNPINQYFGGEYALYMMAKAQ
jgi:hypothetical protein